MSRSFYFRLPSVFSSHSPFGRSPDRAASKDRRVALHDRKAMVDTEFSRYYYLLTGDNRACWRSS